MSNDEEALSYLRERLSETLKIVAQLEASLTTQEESQIKLPSEVNIAEVKKRTQRPVNPRAN